MMNRTKNGRFIILDQGELQVKYTSRSDSDVVRCPCPACSDHREHKKDPSLKMNLRTGYGHCFHCGEYFILKKTWESYEQQWQQRTSKYKRQPVKLDPNTLFTAFSGNLKKYLTDRGISLDTAHQLGVKWKKVMVNAEDPRNPGKEIKVEKEALAFCFYDGKELVNVQYKTCDKDFLFTPHAEIIPYNLNAALLLDHDDTLYITEGMMDCLAIVECGRPNVISVSNGANTKMSTFDAFRASHFDKIGRIVFAGDTDRMGLELQRQVVEYFGYQRCWVVDWQGAKDANEMLIKGGKEAVLHCLDAAHPYPIPKMKTALDYQEQIDNYFMNGIPEGRCVGLKGFDEHVKFETGRMCVISGVPGSGKSSFLDFLLVSLFAEHNWKCIVYSPEKYPTALHYMELAQLVMGKPFHIKNFSKLVEQDTINYLSKNFVHIEQDENDIESILQTARLIKQATGARVLAIDPFNYIALPMNTGQEMTQKISDVLKRIVDFSHEEDMLVFVVAHPRKTTSNDGKPITLNLYDIAGSADFANKADYGIILQRNSTDDGVIVDILKIRFAHLGKVGKCTVFFNKQNNRFTGSTRGTEVDRRNGRAYVPLAHDNSNWLRGRAVQQQLLNLME